MSGTRSEPGPRLWGMLPTPFTPSADSVDHESLDRLVREYERQGCTGHMVFGVIAEPEALDRTEKRAVAETVLGAAQMPVVAAALSRDPAETLSIVSTELVDHLDGFFAIMVNVAFADAPSLRAHLTSVHELSGRPLIVQDYPAASGISITVEHLAQAIEGLPFVHAIKCEAAPTFLRIRQLRETSRVRLIAGLGGIGFVDDMRAGATDFAAGISEPRVLARALAEWGDGATDAAAARIADASALIAYETQQVTSIGIRKEHLRRGGIIATAATRSALAFPQQLAAFSTAHGIAPRP